MVDIQSGIAYYSRRSENFELRVFLGTQLRTIFGYFVKHWPLPVSSRGTHAHNICRVTFHALLRFLSLCHDHYIKDHILMQRS